MMGKMQALSDLKDRRRQLADGFLLLTNDALPLLDEPDAHRDRNAIGGRLVGVQNLVELGEVLVVRSEQ